MGSEHRRASSAALSTGRVRLCHHQRTDGDAIPGVCMPQGMCATIRRGRSSRLQAMGRLPHSLQGGYSAHYEGHLCQDVAGSGEVGEVREVARGFARNFLIPRGLAVEAAPEP